MNFSACTATENVSRQARMKLNNMNYFFAISLSLRIGAIDRDRSLRYTPSDCFETFSFSEPWETHPALEAAGKAYYDFPATLMIRTCNRFHDRHDENTPTSPVSALCTPTWTAPSSTPTAGTTSPPTANSASTTRSARTSGAAGRSPPLSLARRHPQRGPRPPPGTERRPRRRGSPRRRSQRAKLSPGHSGPRPQRPQRPQRRTAPSHSHPVAEPRGLWEDNPPNEPDPGASAGEQEGGEPDPGAGVDGQGDADGQED